MKQKVGHLKILQIDRPLAYYPRKKMNAQIKLQMKEKLYLIPQKYRKL